MYIIYYKTDISWVEYTRLNNRKDLLDNINEILDNNVNCLFKVRVFNNLKEK